MTADELERIWLSPREFIERLQIVTDLNERRWLYPWFEEQEWLFAALTSGRRNTLVLKCRQVGFTTLTLAYHFVRAYTSISGRRVLDIVHNDDTNVTLRQRLRHFFRELPPQLRFSMKPDNLFESGFGHNGSVFRRIVAGGGGQARGDTYTDLHCTEMAKWPQGSAAHSDADTATDADIWQSANATIHVPDASVVVESTGNGPRGKFYDLWKTAKASAVRADSKWSYVFVPWTQCYRYKSPVADKKAFEGSLNDDEKKLYRDHGLSLEQLQWRRDKLSEEDWSPLRFRREYPLTDLEPFMTESLGWFDQEALNDALAVIPNTHEHRAICEQPVKVFVAYERGRKHFMGVDTAGGVGRDEAVIKVWRDDLIECAAWHSSTASPAEQAVMTNTIGGLFGKPLCIVEANKYGLAVIHKIEEAGSPGVILWKDERGKDFWTSGGRAGDSKREAFVHARELVKNGWVLYNYAESVHQAQQVVEHPDGRIAGAGDTHDDIVMADVLAWWCAKPYIRRPGTVEDERERHRARMRRRRNALGKPK